MESQSQSFELTLQKQFGTSQETAFVITTMLLIISLLQLFVGLGSISEKCLVPAVDRLRRRMRISQELAGVTLMAFCCSMSEILTNVSVIISACLHERKATKSHLPGSDSSADSAQGIVDLGFATVIGSAIFQFTMTVAVVCWALPNGQRLKMWQISRDLIVYSIGVIYLTFCLSDSRVDIRDAFVLLAIWSAWLLQVSWGDRRRQEVEEAQDEQQESTTLISIDQGKPNENRFINALCTIFLHPVEWVIDQTFLDVTTLEPLSQDTREEEYLSLKDPEKGIELLDRQLLSPKVRYAQIKELMNMICVIVVFSFFSQQLTTTVESLSLRLHIPASLMGMVFMNLGTNAPDMANAVATIRLSRPHMGIASLFASQVHNILFGLSMPWLVYFGFNPNKRLFLGKLTTEMVYQIAFCIAILIITMYLRGFRSQKSTAIVCTGAYLLVVIMCSIRHINFTE